MGLPPSVKNQLLRLCLTVQSAAYSLRGGFAIEPKRKEPLWIKGSSLWHQVMFKQASLNVLDLLAHLLDEDLQLDGGLGHLGVDGL